MRGKAIETSLRNLRKWCALQLAIVRRLRQTSLDDLVFEQLIASRDCPKAFSALARAHTKHPLRIQNTSNLCRYLELVRPLTHPSLELRRFGGPGDGGYEMLPPPPVPLRGAKPKALSLGVSESAPWDLEMANLGYEVLEFDASIESSPYPWHANIKFFKKFVGLVDNENTISLERILSEARLEPGLHNILQCDIEGAEWGILDGLDLGRLAAYFPQLIFEFHGCNPDDEIASASRFRILENLLAFYAPIWTHYNNMGPLSTARVGSRLVPFFTSLEVSYLRRDLIPSTARPLEDFIGGLPESSNPAKPDIPLIFPKQAAFLESKIS